MKKLLLLLTLTFSITSSAQYAILSAVDVKDGMEEQYLALEAFFGPIHDLAIEKGMLNSQAVFKVINTTDDGENVADYFIISGFSSIPCTSYECHCKLLILSGNWENKLS